MRNELKHEQPGVVPGVVMEEVVGGTERQVSFSRMLRLRLAPMLITFFAIAVPGLLAAWYFVPLGYTATAEVRFLASTPRVLESGAPSGSTVPYEKFLNTQVNLITGSAILSRVLEEPEVRRLPFVGAQGDALNFLKGVLKADIQQNSEIVSISCTLPDPAAARLIVDKALAAYMQYALGEEANVGGERLRILSKERDTRQAELDTQLRRIGELQREIGLPLGSASQLGSPEEVSAYREILARAQEEVTTSQSRATAIGEQLAAVRSLQEQNAKAPAKAIYDFGIEEKLTADPRVAAARQDVARAETVLAQMEQRYADGSPQLEVERENFGAIWNRLGKTERQVRGEMLQAVVAKLEADGATVQKGVEDAQARIDKFQGMIDANTKRALDASRSLAELDELKLRAEETRGLLRTVREQISSIGVESNAPARVKVASAPVLPVTPEGGKRLQFFLLAIVLAGGASFGVGFVRELTDQQIRSVEDVAMVTSRPVLASIPHGSQDKIDDLKNIPTAVADYPGTATANEFRKVLTQLVFADETAVEINSCLITSPSQGDGKTSVACNLAIALAEANRRVLLVDTTPSASIEEHLELPPARGLSEILFGNYPLAEIVQQTVFPGLFVLTAGYDVDRLAAKLASREMMQLLEEAERHFDHVIIDTPPELLLSDAKLLAPVVDGVVVVVGAGVSTLGMFRRCMADLEQVGANLLGIVLNGIRPSLGGHLKRDMALFDTYFRDQPQRKGAEQVPEMQLLDNEPDS
ncbi:MAG: polysaccharide biosynthesis tyrosine autokinase [Candidatus Hydrogenedentes bacterium]|nr:polysaccharide biosynthesis tyrosine autokinase [Candidatus Hydrogenedentota bacterium]